MSVKEDQFRKLVYQNRERIQRICRFYAPAPEDQQDLYQETLINIWKSLDTFRGESAISTWIYRIAVNTSLNFAGKELRRLKLNTSMDAGYIIHLIADESIDPPASKEKRLEMLEDLVNQLSVVDKILISLTLEGLSSREIAEIVGITEPNVRVKIHRIKETLRNQIKALSHEEP
jgi:RNA polymerase sigma-70 factor (ECF subfamily)